MSDSSDDGCGTVVLAIIGIVIGLYLLFLLVVYVIIPLVAVIASIGIAWGGGHSVVNYFKACRANIEFEKP